MPEDKLQLQFRGHKPEYQNRLFCHKTKSGVTIFGVFSAHLGSDAAKFSCKFISHYLDHNLKPGLQLSEERAVAVLEQAFEKCQINMMIHKNADLFVRSGASATVGILFGRTLTVANVGDVRCMLTQKPHHDTGNEDSININIAHDDTFNNQNDSSKIMYERYGWYEDDLICGKVRVMRALGDLWQIAELGWQSPNNLKYLSIKSLKANAADVSTVMKVIGAKPPIWCIDYHPHITVQHLESDFDYIVLYTSSLNEFVAENEICKLFKGSDVTQSSLVRQLKKQIRSRQKSKVDNVTLLAVSLSDHVNNDQRLIISQ